MTSACARQLFDDRPFSRILESKEWLASQARGACVSMPGVRSRWLTFLLIGLLALPASWAAPGLAFDAHTHGASGADPCAMQDHAPGDDCPCCPDSGGSVASCLSSCPAVVAAPVTLLVPIVFLSSVRPAVHPAASFTSRADLPFKPPPIR